MQSQLDLRDLLPGFALHPLCRAGRVPIVCITAGSHVSSIGTARSAFPAVGLMSDSNVPE